MLLIIVLALVAVACFGTAPLVAASGPVSIYSANSTTFFEAVPGTFTALGSNVGCGNSLWSETGSLPAGVTFSGDSSTLSTTFPTATLAGTPTLGTAGTWTIYIHLAPAVVGGVCLEAVQTFTLTVQAGAAYTAVTPVRLLDTRNGTGAPAGRLGAHGSLDLVVGGTTLGDAIAQGLVDLPLLTRLTPQPERQPLGVMLSGAAADLDEAAQRRLDSDL